MSRSPEHIRGRTFHGRRGGIRNAFSYGVDFALIDPDAPSAAALFSRNGFNLAAVNDCDHGGARGQGRGVAWVREVLEAHGLHDLADAEILLLTQPSFLGYIFNPVSFWLVMRGSDLLAVIAEVNNTFGDRHNYLCHNPDLRPILPTDRLQAQKVFHVSPFQAVSGSYEFSFQVTDALVNIRINHQNGSDGVIATLTGKREKLTSLGLLWAAIRRPFGTLRVIFLIYWQAIKLRLKGAQYNRRPQPPEKEVS